MCDIEPVGAHLTDRFASIVSHPIVRAACIFEHVRWPAALQYDELMKYGNDEIDRLLSYYSVLFGYLVGDETNAKREWLRMKSYVMCNTVCACEPQLPRALPAPLRSPLGGGR